MTRNELREKVARAICKHQDEDPDDTSDSHPKWRGWHQYAGAADVAIDETLEEAAKVADEYAEKDWRLGEGFRNKAGLDIASALRAMKGRKG